MTATIATDEPPPVVMPDVDGVFYSVIVHHSLGTHHFLCSSLADAREQYAYYVDQGYRCEVKGSRSFRLQNWTVDMSRAGAA